MKTLGKQELLEALGGELDRTPYWRVLAKQTGLKGPWDDEPDRLEWRWYGLPCLMVRSFTMGSWCGYVAVSPGHPLHGKHPDEIDDVYVHGGISYAESCQGDVCHVPRKGEPDNVWWLGFDCGHGHDISPAFEASMGMFSSGYALPTTGPWKWTYKDVAYVKKQVRRLAKQLALMEA
jgi:hypothetical protein